VTRRLALLALLALALPNLAHARTTEPALLDGWMVDRWTIDDGLPLNHIRDMAFDNEGYAWFGTFDGLARFDGREMRVFRRANLPVLTSNRVPFVEAAKGGGVWALTEDGDLLRLGAGPPRVWPQGGAEIAGLLNRFQTFGDVSYAFGFGGVVRLDDDGPTEVVAPTGERITSLDQAPDGSLWFTVETRGLYRVAPQGPVLVTEALDAHFVTHLPDGRRLLGTTRWVAFVGDDGALITLPGELDSEELCEVTLAPSGALLLRTALGWYRDGLVDRIGDVLRTTCGSHAMSLAATWRADNDGLYLDGEPIARSEQPIVGVASHRGELWAITNGSGVMRLRKRLVESRPPLGSIDDDLIYSLLPEQDGQAWVGTSRAGPWRLSPAPQRVDTGETWRANHTIALARDADGGVWAGNDWGACRVDGDTCTYVLEDVHAVRAFHVAHDGEVWAASEDGLWRDLAGTSRLVEELGGAPVGSGRVFAPGRDDEEVWLGTMRSGVLQLRGDDVRRWTTADGLSSDRIRSFLMDGDDVWIGTGDGGICRLRPETGAIACVTTEDGLHEDCVHSLFVDDQQRLWMSTNRGIAWVPFAHVREVADGTREQVDGVVLGVAHGMRDREGNGGQGSVAGWDDSKRLWFATQSGAAVVDPAQVPVPSPPPVAFDELRVDGARRGESEWRAGETLRLEPGEGQLRVRWSAPELAWPDALRFRYRLAPHTEWRGPTVEREAVWLELPPGPFSVEVQAGLAGAWSAPATITGERRPAFAETSGFLLALLGLALGGVGGVALWRGRLQRQRQKELEDEVARRTAGLESTTRALQRQNEEIARQNREIAAQAERLEELDALRKRLVADLSHELRTPLALVAGPLQDLADDAPRLSPVNKQRLEVVQRSVGRLQDLIGQLFDLTRLEHGRLPLRARRQDLSGLTAAVMTSFQVPFAEAGVRLTGDVGAARWLYYDGDLVEKVLTNLLSNALKFTPKGGAVTVSVVDHGDGARVAVQDTGIGVDAADQARLFDRFFQADQGDQRRFEGAGIGLALCRELIELHGGTIGVDSAAGAGSTFWFELPGGVAHLAPDDIDTGTTPEPLAELPPLPTEEDAAGGASILVVEDHPDMRQYLAAHLRSRFDVAEAPDAIEALKLIADDPPSLIVSDIMMPVMDGLTLARQLRGNPETAQIPIVLVSAKATDEDRREGLEVADAYLAKPVRMRTLVETVARLTKSVEPEPEPAAPSEADVQLLERLTLVTRRHLAADQFGVKEMAGHLALSPRQMRRTVRRLTGMAPSEFLREQRMEVAHELLVGGTYTTTAEVAAQVGLTPAYFSRLYTNWYGHPPTDDLP